MNSVNRYIKVFLVNKKFLDSYSHFALKEEFYVLKYIELTTSLK